MEWDTYPDKAKQLKAITDAAKQADALILATDPDREGEAISWHVQEVLKKRRRSRRVDERSSLQRHYQECRDGGHGQAARAR